MKFYSILLFGAFVPGLVACGSSSRPGMATTRSNGVTTERVDTSWSAERVKISCAGAHCRAPIGMLAYLEVKPEGNFIHRCTATLIDADRVLSSYHCAAVGTVGYFILPNALRKIAGVEFKAYSGLDAAGAPIIRPDAVILKLDRPITDVEPLAFATKGTLATDLLEAVVVNAANKPNQYQVDAIKCRVGRHPTLFPFDLSENPDLIYGFGCRLIPGNSGSPLFTAGDTHVQGVVQMIKEQDPDGLMTAANARCYDKSATCARVPDGSIKRRRRAMAEGDEDGVRALGQSTRATFPTEMLLGRLLLASRLDGREAFEVNDLPKCVRPGVGELKELQFLDQLIAMDRDGQPVEVRRRVRTGRVLKHFGRTYFIEVTWPEPFAPLAKPDEHPSRRADLRSPLKIDLPECAR